MIYSQSPSPQPPSPLTVTIKTTIKDMLKNHEQSDFSGFSPQHPMFHKLPENIERLRVKNVKKKVGCMKEEMNGNILLEFVKIRVKAYSLKRVTYGENFKECQKSKGIKRGTVEKTIHHNHFLDCVQNDSVLYSQFNTFRSYNHKISTIMER